MLIYQWVPRAYFNVAHFRARKREVIDARSGWLPVLQRQRLLLLGRRIMEDLGCAEVYFDVTFLGVGDGASLQTYTFSARDLF